MELLDFKCGKCTCKIYGLGDDYYCPICQKLFCFDCIEKHGCNIELEPPKYITGRWKVKKI